jgi:hypothetical protein
VWTGDARDTRPGPGHGLAHECMWLSCIRHDSVRSKDHTNPTVTGFELRYTSQVDHVEREVGSTILRILGEVHGGR